VWVKLVKGGAYAYVPKDKMADITGYIADIISGNQIDGKRSGRWFSELKSNFDEKLEDRWQEKEKDLGHALRRVFKFSREELEEIL